ncbi:MAG: hypothetical protein WBH99_06330 [Azovibrio sp.]|uniref:DUF7931 domain-containing protein n=1 Tax=Azovibrio sp. TaxID=1872673 RepID=UPI003C78183C
MTTYILDNWGEFRNALERTLSLAEDGVCVFDADLAQLGFQQATCIEQLQRLLVGNPAASIRIALKRVDHLHRDHPRLIQLLTHHSHAVQVQQIHENLAHLRETIVISDARHAVIRFDQDSPRSKLILAAPLEVAPYRKRFEDIWREGGEAFSPTQLGL